MYCICRYNERGGDDDDECEEIIPNVINTECIDDRKWTLIEFRTAVNRRKITWRWIKVEFKEFDIVSMVKEVAIEQWMRLGSGTLKLFIPKKKHVVERCRDGILPILYCSASSKEARGSPFLSSLTINATLAWLNLENRLVQGIRSVFFKTR